MHCEISTDPRDILKSSHLDVVPYALRVSALSERLGIDLSSTLFALHSVPLCQGRGSHAEIRRAAAGLIADRTPALREAIPAMVEERCAVLCRAGRVEVMEEVIRPLTSDTLSILVGMPIDMGDYDLISRIFSQTLGVAKRRRMERELGDLVSRLRRAFPDAGDDIVGLKLALAILGRDAMMGTFGCTLHDLARAQEGGAWSALDWPEVPTRTGVPYIDRIALKQVSVGGETHAEGDTVRAQLTRLEAAEDPRARLGFFGSGAHLCLGRALTLDLWSALSACLAQSSARVRVCDYALRRDDVFHIPQILMLEIATE
ncbi:hypothetical protein [Frigidibacter sp. ROC022]|uniref:hypothetical protein n=1 Tax=Frigidibacter sp. ROC022 TaxID=2971796 RepID=UPI00215B5D6B|nr:hypothetical protein [Frigidibacter sp. ROC022]MCR8725577.1 hypothetical protein [Frigidibacter sp. ROC022]